MSGQLHLPSNRWRALGGLVAAGALLAALAGGEPALAQTLTAPGSPSGVTAVAGEASATVSWTAPSSDGGSPITSYTVTASPGGETAKALGTSLVTTIGGLPDGTAESFTVTATNSAGTGPPSTASNQVTPGHPGGQYFPLTPYRICDTRANNPSNLSGLNLSQCEGKTLGPGGSLTIQVAGTNPSGQTSGGVLSSGVSAVVLNVTVTDTTAPSYLTVWPAGATRPTASTLNWVGGETVPNLSEVAVGTGGDVSFYNDQGQADLVVDVEGYVLPSPTGQSGLFTGLTPYRICDTRANNPSNLSGLNLSQCEGKTLGPGGSLTIQVSGTNPSGQTSGGVPSSGVSAVVLNVTVTDTTAPSYLTVWPAGAPQPLASNLNWSGGQTVPNRVIIPVGTGGEVSFYNDQGQADLVVDVGGWFTNGSQAGTPGSYFTGGPPQRICDTRAGNPSGLSGGADQCLGKTLGPGGTLTIQVAGLGGVAAEDTPTPPVAVVLNVTVTDTTAPSYLTVWPAGAPQPLASDLNWSPGQTIANAVVVALGSGGQISLYNDQGSTDVVVDVAGYESGTDVIPSNTVPLNSQSMSLLTGVGAGESSLTFSGSDSQLAALVPGDIVNSGVTALTPYGLLALVTGVSSGGSTLTTVPATLSDALPQGSFGYQGTATSYLASSASSAQLRAAPQQTPGQNGDVNPDESASAACSAGGSVDLTAKIDQFQVTPSFPNPGWMWPNTFSASASLRLDEGYTVNVTASTSAGCSATVPIVPTTPIGTEIPIDVGPIVFTLTPTYSVSAVFSVSASVTATSTITQAAYRQVGFTFSTSTGFSPTGSSGCDPPIPAGTPLCAEVMAPPSPSSGSATVSGGLDLQFLLAVDYVPGVSTVGPYLEGGVSLQVTFQSQAPVWSLGLNFTASVGFTIDLLDGAVNVDDSAQILDLTITLAHAVEVTTTSLPAAQVGVVYSATLAADGGTAPYTWAFATGSSPPSWLSLSSGGVLAGTPPQSAAGSSVTIQIAVTDSSGVPTTALANLALQVLPGPLSISTTSPLPSAVVGTAYNFTLQASGGILPYSWAVTSGSLPSGLSLDSSTGVLSGTPTTVGTNAFSITVTDSAGATAVAQLTLSVAPAPISGLTWSTPQSIDPDGGIATLTSVSCPSASFCMAVDQAGRALTWNGSSWLSLRIIDPNGGLSSVSCPSATSCVAVDTSGDALTWNGNSWSSPQSIDPFSPSTGTGGDLTSVSCPTALFCAAVDASDGSLFLWNGTTWSAATDVGLTFTDNAASVSCPSASFCMVVDGDGQDVTWDGSTWSVPQQTTLPVLGGFLDGIQVSCSSSAFCGVVEADTSDPISAAAPPPVLALSPVSASTWSSGSWSSPSQLNPGGQLVYGLVLGVSCSTATECQAIVNSTGPDGAANSEWDGSTWSPIQVVASSGAYSSPTGAVACPTSALCVAVVGSEATMWSGTSWTTPRLIDPAPGVLPGVSCPTATFCAAVDQSGNALTWDGSGWSSPQSIDSTRNLSGVSCPSPTLCVAVDAYGDATVWNGSSWSILHDIDQLNPILAVSCASTSFCMAVDGNGNAVDWNGSLWSAPDFIDSNGYLGSVACTSSSFCVAVDESGHALTWNGSSWSGPASIDSSGLSSVACPTSSFCVAVDASGNALSWNGSSWSSPVSIDSSGLSSVACPTSSFCVAVDGSGNALSWNGSSWSSPVSIDPYSQSTNLGGFLIRVSCASASFCVAVDSTGQALTGT